MSAAAQLKEQGNAKFAAKQYAAAAELYTQALQLDPDNAALHSNRSVSRLLLGDNDGALSNARRCSQLKPEWDKGHFRQGAALEALGDLAQALPAYQRALELNPMSQEVIGKVRELKMKAKVARDQQRRQQQRASHQHGLYAPEATSGSVARDFLIFCKLAVAHKALPPKWDWPAFLATAGGLLGYAFEKSDAKGKWGGENIFSAMMGGRSLRFMGEVVYGSSAMGPDAAGEAHGRLEAALPGSWARLVADARRAWEKLARRVKVERAFGY